MTVYDDIMARQLSSAQTIYDNKVQAKTHYELLLTNLAGDNPNADVLIARSVCAQKIATATTELEAASAQLTALTAKLFDNLSLEDQAAVTYILANVSQSSLGQIFRAPSSPSSIHARAQAGFASLGVDPAQLPQEARDSAYLFAASLLSST